MAVSKAQQRAVTKYDAKAYDKTLLRLPKGKLDVVKAHATARCESVNGFINRAIDRVMAQDTAGTAPEAVGGPQGAGVVSLPSETIEAAQQAAKAAGEDMPAFVARAVETQAQRDDLSRRMKGGKANE